MDKAEFDRLREEQLTTAPKDKPGRHESSNDDAAAPRITVEEQKDGPTKIEIADTAAVRPGRTDRGRSADS